MSLARYSGHQPAGPFKLTSDEDNLTHIERLNPLAEGQSPSFCEGAAAVWYEQPIQTHNGSDIPIGAQFPAPPVLTGWPYEDLVYDDVPLLMLDDNDIGDWPYEAV